ncbi:dolichyl-phosphate-mannose--protein mannosyltransferase [Compostimonas suwonensis]|uniref:Polyprenol-phosphate-mannose--protein mannosyltransferase n=1 Tax=Compostimonas suwonensis TaxID=1048394 RepID=A0A2M9BW17_9MICO|nr:phospholipid carrier-dependent glycosyltransferase [Compostimonas suwonensis]PJJ62136.1 protein-O-mannosyltransferase-like protein [Compostimonas suwonensis]
MSLTPPSDTAAPTAPPSSPSSEPTAETDGSVADTADATVESTNATNATEVADAADAAGTAESPHDDEPRGSRLDDWWARTLSTPLRQRLWYWGGPIAVTVLAAVLRFWNLGNPHALVFDETFYVKDSWTLFNNGYESAWPDTPNPRFEAGETNIFTTDPSFIVHPPLAKWLIALGMAAFGAADSVGWRFSTALIGVLSVVLLMLITRKLFGSTVLAVIAGFILAIEGNAIVMSRVSLLDGYLMFFALLGFGAVLLDRQWHARRLGERVAAARAAGREPGWGPVMWWRPWLIAAGLAFGLASSVKWSGVYFLAGFGVYLIVVDILERRRLGLPFWFSAGVLKQGPATFLLMVPIAFVTYLSSWTGWIVTAGGYYRQWAQTDGEAWTGALSWVPLWAQNLWHYHVAAYNYHVNLDTPHPYQSNPLTWLFMVRPTSMYYESQSMGEAGCGYSNCSEAITGLANPIIWWAATAAVLYLVYRLVRYREWRVGLILMGMLVGYVPWLMYLHRTVFQFYSIAFEPYMILALVFVIGLVLGKRTDVSWRRVRGIRLVGVFLVVSTIVTIFFYPIWTGMQIPFWYWQIHMWIPSWT